MKDKLKALKRETGKWHDIFPIAIIIAVMLIWLVFIIGYTPIEIGILRILSYSEEIIESLAFFLSFIKVWIVLIPVFLIGYNRPMLGQLAFTRRGNSIPGALIGLVLGFATNGACILFSYLKGDIKLSFNSVDPLLLVLLFIVILIQCGAEEIVDRLYLYQKLRRRYSLPMIAIIGSTIAFIMNHLFAPGFSIIPALMVGVTGILWALLIYYYDCLWAAIMFHTAWNFTQSIVFGLPNSGEVSAYSIFVLDTQTAQNGFFYDIAFGVEGSMGAVLIIVVVIIAVLLLNHGKGEKNDLWA